MTVMVDNPLAQQSKLREEFDRLVEAASVDIRDYIHHRCTKADIATRQTLYADALRHMERLLPVLRGISPGDFSTLAKKRVLGAYKHLSRAGQLIEPVTEPTQFAPEIGIAVDGMLFGNSAPSPAFREVVEHMSSVDRRILALYRKRTPVAQAALILGVGKTDYRNWTLDLRTRLKTALAAERAQARPARPVKPAVQPQPPPPEELVYSAYEITTHVPRSSTWVRSRLELLQSLQIERGKRFFYPQAVLDAIVETAQWDPDQPPPPAGDWLTTDAIARRCGRAFAWAQERLKAFAPLAQPRISRRGRPTTHYPPVVCEVLLQESRLTSSLQPQGDWLTETAMARRLSRSIVWVHNRIDDYVELAEARQTSDGHVVGAYPPQVLESLAAESHRYPDELVESWYTIHALARSIGRSPRWVKVQIREYAAQGQMRVSTRDRMEMQYPQAVHDALLAKSRYQASLPPIGDWYTETRMLKLLSRKESWMKRRIGAYRHLAEERQDRNGRVFLAYPQEVFEALRRESDRSRGQSKPDES
ncbi:MAG: hypothetical protein K0S68_307 [Candidatus Saccharibacteria bacterium]|nr:hypothetical protein [Candidatus Saccharibacteria bacterium]